MRQAASRPATEVRIFGVRHHGPGCARSLLGALDAFQPELLLVEGPPEADPLVSFAGDPALRPPVALLVYDPEDPGEAVVYPFHTFSPEWQALRWAAEHGREARFFDLPVGARAGLARGEEEDPGPFALLSRAGGYEDPEVWWEQLVEERGGDPALFEAVAEAMGALRGPEAASPLEQAREAHMRRALRRARAAKIAVICGAWHVPGLIGGDAKADDALLKPLRPGRRVATWIPWTASRMARRSGYGAGVQAPGWYELLFQDPPDRAARWVARAARALRAEGDEASPALVIDAVRLAETLAALRARARPGRAELGDAMLAVLFQGDAPRMARVLAPLELGEALGTVPATVPAMPIQRDLEATVRRLRLPMSPYRVERTLDLRKERDREKSALLHRLRLLGVPWGELREASGRERSTFRESWDLRWEPEFPVRVAECAPLGNTVEAAAAARLREHLAASPGLGALVELLDRSRLARLDEVVDEILAALGLRAALAAEIAELLDAIPPLVRALRYGEVRGGSAPQLEAILSALLDRAMVGLPAAAAQPDDEGARALAQSIGRVNAALALLPTYPPDWRRCLRGLAESEAVVPRVRGRATRLLVEADALEPDALARLARANLSRAERVASSAQWVQGLVEGSGVALLHEPALWRALDDWMQGVAEEDFVAELPGLRRVFAGFSPAERRMMARLLRQQPAAIEAGQALDAARVALVIPALSLLLGVRHDG